ncbi:unnamed protein product [Sphagnum jensenii]|uniref:Uncharacterized protein n=1 Tax=Sphagnum jensenii TaxID=128206 RepID=A0ABP0W370_9BRYO
MPCLHLHAVTYDSGKYTGIVIREPLTLQLNCTLPLSTLMGFPDIPQIRRRNLATDSLLSSQWQNPADILSVLLIIGGDVIQKAIAQLSGDYLVPVAFSFGWVAYLFSTLMSIVGDGCLMPLPDYPAKVINAGSGYSRENRSWILGRLLRDFELPLNDDIGLHITVFQADKEKEAGKPEKDWYWASGFVVIILQLGIAAIPCGLYNDWGIILVTAVGTLLALVTGMLPQWHFEKWACRRKTKKVVILTGGNGTRHVMVIIGDGKGLDLEDLAVGESPRMRKRTEHSNRLARRECDLEGKDKNEILMLRGVPVSFWITQVSCLILAFLWIVFLITVAGLKQNTWYLLAIGGLGMIQNVVIAGVSREPSAMGIHLTKIESIEQFKVMDALMDLESYLEGCGRSLLPEFFNGKLRPAEEKWWDGSDKVQYERARREQRPTRLPEENLPVVPAGNDQQHPKFAKCEEHYEKGRDNFQQLQWQCTTVSSLVQELN